MVEKKEVFSLLEDHIKKAIENNLSVEDIKKLLLKTGWEEDEFLPIFKKLEKKDIDIKVKTLPSTKKIQKDFKKIRKDYYPPELILKAVIYKIFIGLILLILFSLFFNELFLSLFIDAPSDRSYLFEGCSLDERVKCSVIVGQETLSITISPTNYNINHMEFGDCIISEIEKNYAILQNCSFHTISNRYEFSLMFTNPDSKITFTKNGVYGNFFEISRLKSMFSDDE